MLTLLEFLPLRYIHYYVFMLQDACLLNDCHSSRLDRAQSQSCPCPVCQQCDVFMMQFGKTECASGLQLEWNCIVNWVYVCVGSDSVLRGVDYIARLVAMSGFFIYSILKYYIYMHTIF